MKKNFNKKPLIALFVIGLVVAIGGTIAYYTDVVTIPNIFGTKLYQTQVTETFEAPDNWLPGQKVDKVVIAKNTGNVEVAVRAKYEEKWQKNVNGTWTDFETPTPNPVTISMNAGAGEANTETGANTWTELTDGYYYYKTSLAANSQTKPFIYAVTLNDDAIATGTTAANSNCRKTEGDIPAPGHTGSVTWTCGSTSDLNGARYILTVTVETAQADAYKAAWSLDKNSNLVSTSYDEPQQP